jgi:hypothetical protein
MVAALTRTMVNGTGGLMEDSVTLTAADFKAITDKVTQLEELVSLSKEENESLEDGLARQTKLNVALDTENRGWIELYRRLQSEIAGLKAELARHQPPPQSQKA